MNDVYRLLGAVVVGIGLAWLFSMPDERDTLRGRPAKERKLADGLIVGITHTVSVTVVWYAVTHGLVLGSSGGSGP